MTMRLPLRGPLAAALLFAAAFPAGAQQWRTVDVSRQVRDSGAHEVRIKYGAGSLDVRPSDDPVLFAMHLRYDEDAVTPVHRYDAASRTLTLGLGDGSIRLGRSLGKDSHGELRVALTRAVPLSLDLELGAAEARLDLGGLLLRDVEIETGASDSRVSFDRPNRIVMERLSVSAGAANLMLTGVANANARALRIESGVGNVDVRFDGALTQSMDVEATMTLGRVSLTVPRDAGVRVELSRFLAGFDHFGLEKRGDAWYSANWDEATHRIDMKVRTVFGSVAIRRGER
jgi:hypothetical protein